MPYQSQIANTQPSVVLVSLFHLEFYLEIGTFCQRKANDWNYRKSVVFGCNPFFVWYHAVVLSRQHFSVAVVFNPTVGTEGVTASSFSDWPLLPKHNWPMLCTVPEHLTWCTPYSSLVGKWIHSVHWKKCVRSVNSNLSACSCITLGGSALLPTFYNFTVKAAICLY